MERQARCVREALVGGEKRCANMDRPGCNPQIVGVDPVVERVTRLAAGESKLRGGPKNTITDGNDRGCLERLLQAPSPGLAPSSDECPVRSSLTVTAARKIWCPGHQAELRLELGTAATAERSAGHHGVDDDPH